MLNLYLLGEKGYSILRSIDDSMHHLINYVVIGYDKNVLNDFSNLTVQYCERNKIKFYLQNKSIRSSINNITIAVGWRWIIDDGAKLIIFHDSLLPRLRGFNPLVTALINGDNNIGVTVLYGSKEYDKGDIIIQKAIAIEYPLKIQSAIEKISCLYVEAFQELLECILNGYIPSTPQNESLASYSLWRDDDDYFISWEWDSEKIKRFIDAVGSPYKGAKTIIDGLQLYVKDSTVEEDVHIENRTPGKIIFKEENKISIVCGKGVLGVKNFFDSEGNHIDLKKFRTRFK